MPSRDLLHRFLFDKTDIRGEIVTMSDSYQQILANNSQLHPVVQALLGEFVAAASLLASSLKFDGIITLQARGDGPLPLIMAECTHQQTLRAIAQPEADADFDALEGEDLQKLVGKGMLAIIIEPEKGERYQGIVPLDSSSLAGCLQHYFDLSEQLPTRFWLSSDARTATGLMLQALPQQVASAEENAEQWNTSVLLADTVKEEELLQLDHQELIHRLFHEERVRLFDPVPLEFSCSCSRSRSANALISLGREDVEALIAEQDLITIDCKFCNQSYVFGAPDLDEIFGDRTPPLH